MNVKRTLLALTTLALATAMTQVQADTVGAGSSNITDGSTAASVGQTINVNVPKRFGLHLHLSNWVLDLSALNNNGNYSSGFTPSRAQNDAKCVRAGDHSSGTNGTGRDFLYYATGVLSVNANSGKDQKILSLLANAAYEGDQYADTAGNVYSYAGKLTWPAVSNATTFNPNTAANPTNTPPVLASSAIQGPIGGYPGFYVSGGNLVWKGPIMCSFQTIVQKFSNSSNGFKFTADLTAVTGSAAGPIPLNNSFPFPLYVRDYIKSGAGNPLPTGVSTPPANGYGAVTLTSTGGAQTLATGTGTSGGWLDDHLLQVLVFDGSETNGTYVGNVQYNLTDPTPPNNG